MMLLRSILRAVPENRRNYSQTYETPLTGDINYAQGDGNRVMSIYSPRCLSCFLSLFNIGGRK